jgi:hypothetical protein
MCKRLLFSGYEDNMVLMGKANMIEGFDISHIPYDKIGFFYMVSKNFHISSAFNLVPTKKNL